MENEIKNQVISFASSADWEEWLRSYHQIERVIWLRLAKKASGIVTVTYDEALDVALCYGWIDGQKKTEDADHFLQRFTPRTPGSIWSKRNVAKVLSLIQEGRMQPAGLVEVESAKQDGRWQAAYDSPKDMTIPEDFLLAVRQDKETEAFFTTLNRANLYAIGWRLHTAKTPATRARRFAALLEMLKNGEKLH